MAEEEDFDDVCRRYAARGVINVLAVAALVVVICLALAALSGWWR